MKKPHLRLRYIVRVTINRYDEVIRRTTWQVVGPMWLSAQHRTSEAAIAEAQAHYAT